MNRLAPALAFALVVPLIAFAATVRSKTSNGVAPATCAAMRTGGVSLAGVSGCRLSVSVDGGGDLGGGGKLIPYVCADDLATSEPVEAPSSLACTLANNLDGGLRSSYFCDLAISVPTGFLMTTGYGVKGIDGGTGAALLEDAGIGPLPVYRTTCTSPAPAQ